MAKLVNTSEDEQKALAVCVNELEKNDQFVREKNIRQWKKAEEYWRLNQYIFWDEIALDYKSINVKNNSQDDNEEPTPKTFGIYRAFGESLIAAMAAGIPSVLYFPDDTDNPDDITTAKAYSLISELVQKHNQAPLLLIHVLMLLYNQGSVASYVYYDEDEKYGTIKTPQFKDETLKLKKLNCTHCGTQLASEQVGEEDDSEDYDKTDESSNEENSVPEEGQKQPEITPDEQKDVDAEKPLEKEYKCPNCGYEGQPEAGEVFEETIPRLTGYSDNPKGRTIIEMYGPLNVRFNSYAKKQSDVGLLELQVEMDAAAARDEFGVKENGDDDDELMDKIVSTSDTYTYERWGRTSSELLSDTLYNQVTVRYCWIRPWGFRSLGKDRRNLAKSLKKKFPHGCCVIFVNDLFIKAYDESMDDHWTLSKNPLDNWLLGFPIGKPGIDTQDAFNELKNLDLQKAEFGITETFVSTDMIDENNYRSQKAGPGYITFVDGVPGEALGNSFFQTKTASVDGDDLEVTDSFRSLNEFLVGAVPSIFGGNQATGSKTASEYNQSRNFAIQRLSNHWTTVKYFWAETMGKASRLFATKMVEDEKFVKKNGNSLETVWIRTAELNGKIGNVEPDVDEQFPVTWAQKRDLFVQMITLQNEAIGAIMLNPNNAELTKSALGFPEFYIPGEDDRSKQLVEIRKLILVTADQVPPNATQPTVIIDPDVDDDQTHITVIKLWAVSEQGLYIKDSNPSGYLNVILHLRMHVQHQQSMMQQQPPKLQQVSSKPNQPTKVA